MPANQSGSQSSDSSNRGLASMDEGMPREIASKGGRNVPDDEGGFAKGRERVSEASKIGGEARGSSASPSVS
jgi:general stress protein YciG